MKFSPGAVVWLGASLQLLSQQVPDPSFPTKVDQPTYREHGPKVLIDAAHHNVHTADGGYKTFAGLMTSDGYAIESNQSPFQASTLEGRQILVIANARGAGNDAPMTDRTKPAFTEEEYLAVQDWVRGGGSLLLVADHWPIGDATERLSLQFGVSMTKGYAHDPVNSDPSMGDTSTLVYSRANGLLAEHPVTLGRDAKERITRVVAFTGQALLGPKESFSFLRLADTACDLSIPDNNKTSVAGQSQGLAFEYGKGRVIILGEAAMLTAQLVGPKRRPMGMNAPGIDNRQLALNIMHWLSRELP